MRDRTGISFAEADVTSPDGTVFEGASISTRTGVLVVRNGVDVLARAEGVTSVRRHSRKRWSITVDGATWQVLRTNCGCG